MADYVMREMNDVRGTGETVFYPKIARFRLFSEEEFVAKMAMEGSGLSKGQVESVLTALKGRIAEMLALGYTVKVKGLGSFSTSLGVKDGKDMETGEDTETKRNAQSIEVRNILFKADKDLIADTNMKCRLVRKGVKNIRRIGSTEEERMAMAKDYLNEHPFMHVADYMRITGMSRTLATLELQKFRQDETSGITTTGRGCHKVYVMKKD